MGHMHSHDSRNLRFFNLFLCLLFFCWGIVSPFSLLIFLDVSSRLVGGC